MPNFTKKAMAKTMSITGKTTLSTTVLICVDAVVQVLSTAEATSPLPAAEATVANSRQSSAQKTSSFPRFRIFIINYSPFHSSTNTTERTSCSVTGCETADTTAS